MGSVVISCSSLFALALVSVAATPLRRFPVSSGILGLVLLFFGCAVSELIALPVLLLWAVVGPMIAWGLPRWECLLGGCFCWVLALTLYNGSFALKQADALNRYPLVSLADRLPPHAASPAMEADGLEQFTFGFDRAASEWSVQMYGGRLEQLHTDRLAHFLAAPGFGVGRTLTPRWPVRAGRSEERLPQPEADPKWVKSFGPRTEVVGASYHLDAVLDFAHPRRWGYVRDRDHVAGFRPHQFQEYPKPTQLRLTRLDLLGLVMHAEPAVYVTDNLPRMDDLRNVPTRSPDEFETAALRDSRLRQGQVVTDADWPTRMLGPIPATAQCLKCHDVPEGTLLGAFSYRFTR